jgi:uncharacterized protein
MTTVFIIHGTGGTPVENWIPWLKAELEKKGCTVYVPHFPTPIGQNLENWMNVFDKYSDKLDRDSIIIGHSVGVAFILNILERQKKPIKAAFLVSGFTGLLNNPAFDVVIKTFADRKFDWKKIRANCMRFYIYHSDNDPFVPLSKAEQLSKDLNTEITLVKNAGHFSLLHGYFRFELLLKDVKKEI